MKKITFVLFLLLPIFASSADSQRISFSEYDKKIHSLASDCASKGMPTFSGFCLSQKYDNQTTTSITGALQLISYETFYNKCEHSDFTERNDLLTKTLNIEDTKRFYEEMKPQREAVENYSDYFDFCKTKDENDLSISKKLKWFEYMVDKTSNYVKDKNSGLYLIKKPNGSLNTSINVVEILDVSYSSSPETTSTPSFKTSPVERTGVITEDGIYKSPFHGFQLKIPKVADSTQIRVIQSIISRRPDGSPVTGDVMFLPNDSYGASALVVTRIRDDRPKDTESVLSNFTPPNENELAKAKQKGITYKRLDTVYGATLQRTIKNRRVTQYFPYQVGVDNSGTVSTVGISRFSVAGNFLLEFVVIADSRHVTDVSMLESVAETELDTLMKSLVKLPQLPGI